MKITKQLLDDITYQKARSILEEVSNMRIEPNNENIDQAIDIIKELKEKSETLMLQLKKLQKEIDSFREQQEFTIQELFNLEKKMKELEELQSIISTIRHAYKSVVDKIVQILPKIGCSEFILVTDKYKIRFKGYTIQDFETRGG